ncbi:MAG: hypothetical protein AAFU73_17040 [Planctomycetota bacterium]
MGSARPGSERSILTTKDSVFDEHQLRRAIAVQKRTYALLRWLDDELSARSGFDPSLLRGIDDLAVWIERAAPQIPPDALPLDSDADSTAEYCRFFESFLAASFELDTSYDHPREESLPVGFQLFVERRRVLRRRKPDRHDRATADQLVERYVLGLAEGCGAMAERALEVARAEPRAAALAAYGEELIRRCRGEYVGPETLVLWRRFAWNEHGSPVRGFELRTADILRARDELEAALLH